MQKIKDMLDAQITACVQLQCTVELVYVFAAGLNNIRYDVANNADALVGLHHSLHLQTQALLNALEEIFKACCQMEKNRPQQP